jgi:hypothetical protein
MPSADNISELVLYTFVAAIVLVVLAVVIRLTPWGKRIRQTGRNWQVSQIIAPPPTNQTRIKYEDPINGTKFKYGLGIIGAGLVVAFVYYFIARGGIFPGN